MTHPSSTTPHNVQLTTTEFPGARKALQCSKLLLNRCIRNTLSKASGYLLARSVQQSKTVQTQGFRGVGRLPMETERRCDRVAQRPMAMGWAAISTLTATGSRCTSFAKKMGKNLRNHSRLCSVKAL